MTSAFSDSLVEPGGEHPRISSTPKGMTMKFLAVVGFIGRHQIKNRRQSVYNEPKKMWKLI